MPPFSVSPSLVARYYYHDCERYLRYRATDPGRRKAEGVPAAPYDTSPVMRAITDGGYAWEEKVVRDHLAGRASVAPGQGPLHQRVFTVEKTIDLLRCERPGRFIYQPLLRPPPAFYGSLGIDPAFVRFAENRPDLIAVEAGPAGGRLLRVIDVKRSEAVGLTHKVQVLLYALQLDAIVREAGVGDARVDLDEGAVWLGGEDAPQRFPMEQIRPHVERFLRQDLTRILSQPLAEVPWHLYHRCEWCPFFDHCRAEMVRTDDLSRLSHLTSYGKRHLRGAACVRSLPDLDAFLDRPEADAVLAQCASLAGERPYLEARVASLRRGEPIPQGASALGLPTWEDVSLFITVQEEPVDHRIYLAGLLVTARADTAAALFDEAKPRPEVFVAARPADVATVQGQFVARLHEILACVDTFNRQRPREDRLSLQAYVHSESDRSLLIRLLLDALRVPALAPMAMTLLFHFQAPDLVLEERHPGDPVAHPVIVLLYAAGRLLALPVDVSYTLPEALAALESTFTYHRLDAYHYPLGHRLRPDAVHAAWYEGEAQRLDALRNVASTHLYAVRAFLWAIRERCRGVLATPAPAFSLPRETGIATPELSRMAFLARYESVLQCVQLRRGRADTIEVQRLVGSVIELEAISPTEMRVLGDVVIDEDHNGFPAWLLVRRDAARRFVQLGFPDYALRRSVECWPHPDRSLAGIGRLDTDERGFARRLALTGVHFEGGEVAAGEQFLLYPRFMDWTADRVVEALKSLDTAGGGLFLDLVRDPAAASRARPLPPAVEARCAAEEAALDLTPSQGHAYREIRGRSVVAVWGPPGTGKSYFLASVIVGLASASAAAGRPFRCLVTAFTHAAIENVLRMIAKRRRLSGLAPGLAVAKAKEWKGEGGRGDIADVADMDLSEWLDGQTLAVVGATIHSAYKGWNPESAPFDLVVIDEASQLRVPDASIPVGLVSKEGRLVLAGDDRQLPPIIVGEYPEPPPGEAILHRSIFEAVRSGVPGAHPMVRQLLENFRMNDVLTSYSAHLIYGPGYRCVTDQVASARLRLARSPSWSPATTACLDPAHPLVVVIIDGVLAAKENPVEARLVADLVLALREGLLARDGRPYPDDEAFFRDGLFVVCPHRAQIALVRRELGPPRRSWSHPPFVDTVDKMQGQEADAVIVSYGVSDPEFAQNEAEFIYGLNRLNVAMTRGRTKSIIFLPRPLLDASPQVLESPEAARGLAFMRSLVHILERAGPPLDLPLPAGLRAQVLRAAARAAP